MTDTTVMMVTYNRCDFTRATIQHLDQVSGHEFNLVLIDNNSTDDTKDYLKSLSDKTFTNIKSIHVHYNSENKGIGIGRSQGLVLANQYYPGTEWYSTVDNDITVPQNWLKDCIDILRDIPKYGMLGVNFEDKNFPIAKIKGYEFQTKTSGTLGTACTVFNKKVHEKIGYFNTEYGLYGQEDADFGARCKFAGYLLGYLKQNGRCLDQIEFKGEENYESFRKEYRQFKDKIFQSNLQLFYENYRRYATGVKPLFIPKNDDWML